MTKFFKKYWFLSLIIAFLLTGIISSAVPNKYFFGALQLEENESIKPRACFKVTTAAGMKNANESVIFGSTGTSTDLGATFKFDARCTKDEDNAIKELRYIWKFGDSSEDHSYDQPNYQTEHIYYKVGTYKAKLEVYDPDGNGNYYELELKVVKNLGPHIKLSVSPESGTWKQEFTFDATGTYHDQFKDSSLEYRWDFNGDTKVDKDWSKQKKVKYTYPYGTVFDQDAILEVRDPAGMSITKQIQVGIVKNTPPKIEPFVIPNIIGTFENNYIIDAASTQDKESTFKCRIDSEYSGQNDIVFDGNFTSNCLWTKKLKETGVHKFHVEAEDKDGARGSEIISINIDESAPYFAFLKKKGIVSGYNYKMYKIQDYTGDIRVVGQNELTDTDKILKTYYIANDMGVDKEATRAELVKMTLKAFSIQLNNVSKKDDVFEDVVPKDWFYKYIIKAYTEAIITGTDICSGNQCLKYARPNDTVTKGEALAIIFRASQFALLENGEVRFRDVPKEHFAFQYVDTAYTYGFIDPITESVFGVDKPITRAEIAEILYKVLNLENQ